MKRIPADSIRSSSGLPAPGKAGGRRSPERRAACLRCSGSTAAVDHPGEERRLVEPPAQDFVHPFVGVQDVAGHLAAAGRLHSRGLRQEREARRIRVAGLEFEPGRIDGGDVDARRGPGLHPVGDDSHLAELGGQSVRGRLAEPAPFHLVTADEKFAAQEGSGGQDNRLRLENCAGIRTDAADF